MYNIQNKKQTLFCQVKSENLSFPVIDKLLHTFGVINLLSRAKITKQKGLMPIEIILYLFLALFRRNRSINEVLKSLKIQRHKTSINDFLNNSMYNWRKFLLYIATRYINKHKSADPTKNVLIIDDTPRKKSGKMVEYISYGRDHTDGSRYKGYQVVFAGFFNGITCIPIDLALKINKKRCKHSKKGQYPQESHTNQRIREAKLGKNKISMAMIRRAMKSRIFFSYILWDSWYNSSTSFRFVFDYLIPKGIHLISMVKVSKEKYRFKNEELSINEINAKIKPWEIMNLNQIKGIKYKITRIDLIDKNSEQRESIGEATLCIFKFPKQKRIKALISTDTNLSAEEILKKYLCRWYIEVMIKDLKQNFGFDQSMSSKYAPQVSDLSIKCSLYIMVCSIREIHPQKSCYQILFELGCAFETYSTMLMATYIFEVGIKSFLEYALKRNITRVDALLEAYDEVILDFLNRPVFDEYDDEIDLV
jgi:hypothetical protein